MTDAQKEREAVENPPAFPTDGRIQHGTDYDGMSLRDYFAGQALIGVMSVLCRSDYDSNVDSDDWTGPVSDAFDIADEMLRQRAEHLKEGR